MGENAVHLDGRAIFACNSCACRADFDAKVLGGARSVSRFNGERPAATGEIVERQAIGAVRQGHAERARRGCRIGDVDHILHRLGAGEIHIERRTVAQVHSKVHIKAFRLLRPQGIKWPVDEQGVPTLRLEALTKANGIAHANAHDALGDVEATLSFARLMRTQSPKLFDYLLSLRKKAVVADFVDNPERESFVHVSGRISSSLGSASVFTNLGQVHGINTQRLLWDLRFDPTEVLDEDIEALAARRFLRDADAEVDQHRLPIKLLHLNRAPVVVSTAILKEGDIVERMQLDLEAVQKNQRVMAQFNHEVADKLHAVMAEQSAFSSQDSECALYEGFMPNVDRYQLDDFNRVFDKAIIAGRDAQDVTVTEALRRLLGQSWQDARLPELVFRFVARLRPDLLNEDERTQWQSWVDSRLNATPDQPHLGFAGFFATIDALRADAACRDETTLELLTQLKAWGETRIRS